MARLACKTKTGIVQLLIETAAYNTTLTDVTEKRQDVIILIDVTCKMTRRNDFRTEREIVNNKF